MSVELLVAIDRLAESGHTRYVDVFIVILASHVSPRRSDLPSWLPPAYYPHPSVLLPVPRLAPSHTLDLTKIDLLGPLGGCLCCLEN